MHSVNQVFVSQLDAILTQNKDAGSEILGHLWYAVVFLPAERIVVAGDLVVRPILYTYDGYPMEWAKILDAMLQLGTTTVVPGHGPASHHTSYVILVRDLMHRVVTQLTAAPVPIGAALAHSVNEVKCRIDLTAFKRGFAGDDKARGAEFDESTSSLIQLACREASLR